MSVVSCAWASPMSSSAGADSAPAPEPVAPVSANSPSAASPDPPTDSPSSAGAALAAAGSVAIAMTFAGGRVGWMAGGCAAAFQQAVNGRVNQVGGPWAATWNNFLVGATLLALFTAVSLLTPGHLRTPPSTWWLYTGGLLGIALISSAAVLVQVHGVLVLGLCTVAGQVLGALAIDATTGREVSLPSVVGAALTLVGVAVASLPGQRRPAREDL
jgi:transporter family-2 protein